MNIFRYTFLFILVFVASASALAQTGDSIPTLILPQASDVDNSAEHAISDSPTERELEAVASDSLAYQYYMAKQYQSALRVYEKLYEEGKKSAAMYFNLGTCHYQLKQYGSAILMLERAKYIDPYNKNIDHNLALARNAVSESGDPLGDSFTSYLLNHVSSFLGLRLLISLGILFAFLFVVGGLLFLLGHSRRQRRVGFYTAFASLILSVVANLLAWHDYRSYRDNDWGIILRSQVSLRAMAGENSTSITVLHEGARVEIRDMPKNGWCAIRTNDGKAGWVKSAEVAAIKP